MYESVKPASFMTVPTSRTSYQRSQVKSRNHGKTHIFQCRIKYFEASSRNSRKEKKERAKLWTRTPHFKANKLRPPKLVA